MTGASLAPEVTTFLAIAASVGLIPFGLAFFAGVLFLDAHMTGWHRLATRFPAAAEPPNVYRRQNGGVGAFGLIQLRGLLRAAPDQRGLYLAFPRFLLRARALPGAVVGACIW